MICSRIYKATTLAAALLISATASAETTEAPRRLAPLPGSTTTTKADGRDFSLQLAKAELARQGIRHPTQRQIDAARSSIQARRSRGEGWGEIAHSLGLNFGKVVSASNHREQDGKQDGKHAEKGERKNTRDGFATVSHRSTQGEGGGDTHGGNSDHSSGSSGSRGNGGGSSHSK